MECKTEKKENYDQVIEELKKSVSGEAKIVQIKKTTKPINDQNRTCRTDCKRFYNLLRQKISNVKSTPTKEETGNF